MAFAVKLWKNDPDPSTPLSAANIMDLETRLSAYSDTVAGGIELGYAAITANATQTGAGNSDVTGLTTTVTVGARPIIVRFSCSGIDSTASNGIAVINIKEGATILATSLSGANVTTPAGLLYPCFREARLAPAAGAHTYKINLQQYVSGNAVLNAASDSPAFIQVLQV